MKSYNELKENFEKDVSSLQNTCPHIEFEWREEWYGIARSTGRQLRICDNCHKVVEIKGKKFWDYKNGD